MGDWRAVAEVLRNPTCQGCGPIQLLSAIPFFDEDELPFLFEGGGSVCHIIPEAGFPKESLAASEDERLLIVNCPDDEGWLAPEDIVRDWLSRHVTCPDLEDVLLAHPLYEYLTQLDDEGHSRGGQRGELIQWAPGIPHLVSIYAPEFLPNDPDAPLVNRDRDAYADAVIDLISKLEEAFDLREIEVGLRFGDEPPPPGEWDEEWDDEDEDDEPGGARVRV